MSEAELAELEAAARVFMVICSNAFECLFVLLILSTKMLMMSTFF